MMGESYHNNHHTHSGRANFGVKWHEVDFTYLIMVVLDKLRLIKLKKTTAKVS
jgi:stearoyl-CoA desaturase (delta-9 desaturase)